MIIITLDNEGRITLPEDIRQQLKVKKGQKICARIEAGRLIIEAAQSPEPRPEATLRFVQGVPVFDVEGATDVVAAIDVMREERDRHNLGLMKV